MKNDSRPRVSFRPLDIESDVHRLYNWLSDEDVRTWYDEGEHSVENYRQKFAPEPTTHRYIIEIDQQPAGYIQAYWLHDEPDYARQLPLEHDAVSLDIFIGAGEFRGQGWGSAALITFLREVVFGRMQAEYACINPDPANTRAVRSYEKVGFRGDRVVNIAADEPGDAGPERIMVLARTAFTAGESGYGSGVNS